MSVLFEPTLSFQHEFLNQPLQFPHTEHLRDFEPISVITVTNYFNCLNPFQILNTRHIEILTASLDNRLTMTQGAVTTQKELDF